MSDLIPNQNNFILYSTPEGAVKLNVLLENETIWLTQKAMGILFDTTPQNITIHLKNIFESGELDLGSTCKDYLQVQKEGNREVSRNQKMYNLDVLLSGEILLHTKRSFAPLRYAQDDNNLYLTGLGLGGSC
ncbi:MAG: cell filamentation protein Fic, partial [Bacteroidota bacterium]|nr:cell filamentation protein Fic [Bacteroidota bacterium]